MPNDNDFLQLQNVYKFLINTSRNRVYRTTKELENIFDYSDFKTIVTEMHISGLHQGIEKVAKCFKEKYYYPNYLKEISNIINSCELCNHCKSDHITYKLPFKVTPPTYEIREKFVLDFWKWDNEYYLTCIDLFSKFAMVEKVKALNWLESKRTLLKIFNTMGPPKVMKVDQDQGLNNTNIKQWCDQMNIKIEVTTGKTGIGDIERLHKTLNEKLRIIHTSEDKELKYLEIEQAIYTYNHIIIHSTTEEIPYNIFFNKQPPKNDPQIIKEKRIENINKHRQENEIDTNFVNAENARKRLDKICNPYRQVRLLKTEEDGEHHILNLKIRKSENSI